MKAERIQDQPPNFDGTVVPGWETDAHLALERTLEFPSFVDACRFGVQVARWTGAQGSALAEDAEPPVPQIDIREHRVVLRIPATNASFSEQDRRFAEELGQLAETSQGGVTESF